MLSWYTLYESVDIIFLFAGGSQLKDTVGGVVGLTIPEGFKGFVGTGKVMLVDEDGWDGTVFARATI